MIADIATVPGEVRPSFFYYPVPAVELAGAHYFFTDDGIHGRELWRTDGTTEGTSMVDDVCPGDCSSGFGYPITRLGDAIYFNGDDGVHGRELWRSDGTADGTEMVADAVPGPGSSSPEYLTSALGLLFFAASDPVHGRELWCSDGTVAGTRRLTDISSRYAFPSGLVEVGSWLLFSAQEESDGARLWRSDGTAAGTERVFSGSDGPRVAEEQSAYRHFFSAVLDDRLVFSGYDATHGWEAWISDGTEAGTQRLADVSPGASDGALDHFTTMEDHVYFMGETGYEDRELWRTDGTTAGTERVIDLRPGPEGSFPGALTAVGSSLYFAAETSSTGRELWVTDGTEAGTRLIRDIIPGANGGLAWTATYGLNAVDDRLLFSADDGVHGLEPWVSDGTEAGTIALADIAPGELGTFDPYGLVFLASEIGSDAFFFAYDPEHGWEPWLSDGTPDGTRPLRDIDDQVSSVPENLRMHRSFLADLDGTLLFPARTTDFGEELWRSDGTEAGTALVRDIDPTVYPSAGAPFAADSWPQDLTVLGDRVLFIASDPEHGREVWVSDGTTAGTELVEDLYPGIDSSDPYDPTVFGGAVYFSGDDGTDHRTWRTSGTPGDVSVLLDARGHDFTEAAGQLFFLSSDFSPSGGALLRSDGTAAYTTEIVPDGVTDLAGAGPWLYFVRDGELWRTDGTPEETVQLTAFATAPGVSSSDDGPYGIDGASLAGVPATGALLFFADDGVHGLEPWWSDGTPEGTALLADVRPGFDSSWPRRALAGGWSHFFWADDGATGVEPWVTDGTPAGTHLLADIQPGAGSSFTMTWTSAATALYGELFFAAYREAEGVELWRSDGTESGTTLFQDVNPGAGSSSPDSMTISNGRMVFTANDGVHGFELWAAPMAPPGIALLLSASGGFFPGGTVVYTLILENTGDIPLLDGPGAEALLAIPTGLEVLSIDADRGQVLFQLDGGTVSWSGSVPPRGAATIEIVTRVGDLPPGTEVTAHASALFDTTGDGIVEPAVASDDPATGDEGDATLFVVGEAPLPVPVLSLPGLLALASLLAGAASRTLRRRHPPPGSGASGSSSTAR